MNDVAHHKLFFHAAYLPGTKGVIAYRLVMEYNGQSRNCGMAGESPVPEPSPTYVQIFALREGLEMVSTKPLFDTVKVLDVYGSSQMVMNTMNRFRQPWENSDYYSLFTDTCAVLVRLRKSGVVVNFFHAPKLLNPATRYEWEIKPKGVDN